MDENPSKVEIWLGFNEFLEIVNSGIIMEFQLLKIPEPVNTEYISLFRGLEDILNEGPITIRLIEKCLATIDNKIKWLRNYWTKKESISEEEEILFFKTIKPLFYSELIYYSKIYKIEIRRPVGSTKAEKSFLLGELDHINHYFESNQGFYHYYRSGASHLDKQYFTKINKEAVMFFYPRYMDIDQNFSASHDYLVSKILANDLLRSYLLNSVQNLKKKGQNKIIGTSTDQEMVWTASLAALNEVSYALKATGAINNGNIAVSQIAEGLGKLYNIKTGNIYRRQQENRLRKDPCPFLDLMKKKYIELSNYTDEHPHPSSK